MTVRMRLRREGKKKQPYFRVVVADSRSPRDGRYIEDIGYYQPLTDPSTIEIDEGRALYWLGTGVQPSDQVKQLLRVTGIWEQFKPGDVGRDRTAKHEAREKAAEERDRKIAEAEAAAAKAIAEKQAAEEAERRAAEEAAAAEAAGEVAEDAGADEASDSAEAETGEATDDDAAEAGGAAAAEDASTEES